MFDLNEVDVICEHKSDGSIIPLRLRFMNEDGVYNVFTIKGYRKSDRKGAHTTEDGVYTTDSTFIFECLFIVLGIKKS